MFKKYRAFTAVFAVIFLLQVIAVVLKHQWLANASASLIALSLALFFVLQTRLKGRFHKRLFTGLVFAGLGNLLFMAESPDRSYFLYGLTAFFFANLFYTRAFYLDFSAAPERDKKGARWAIVLCSLFGMCFYLWIRSALGPVKIPGMAYVFISCMMVMMAVFRNQRINKSSFNLVLAGAIVLLLSICLFAYHYFVQSSQAGGLLVLASYMLAQYLIVIGGVERKLLFQ